MLLCVECRRALTLAFLGLGATCDFTELDSSDQAFSVHPPTRASSSPAPFVIHTSDGDVEDVKHSYREGILKISVTVPKAPGGPWATWFRGCMSQFQLPGSLDSPLVCYLSLSSRHVYVCWCFCDSFSFDSWLYLIPFFQFFFYFLLHIHLCLLCNKQLPCLYQAPGGWKLYVAWACVELWMRIISD